MRKIYLLVSAFILFSIPNGFAQGYPALSRPSAISPETKELVRNLLEANGMRANMIRIFEDIISQAPRESQADLRAVLKGDTVIEKIIPVYAKHFTPDELKELIHFYKSPVGAKNLNLTPVLMTEVMQVSQKYFEESTQSLQKPASANGVNSKIKK